MSKKMKRLNQISEYFIRLFEVGFSFFLVIGIFIEVILHAKRLWNVTYASGLQSFQIFLDNILIYIIGLEIAMMFVKREPEIMLDIFIFAIVRKMIIDTASGLDFLLGALAIMILYFVKCYGISCLLLPGSFRRDKQKKNVNPEPSTSASET